MKDTAWAQEHLGTLMSTTSRKAAHFSAARAHLKWTDTKWKSLQWSDESTFQIVFLESMDIVTSVPKKKRTI